MGQTHAARDVYALPFGRVPIASGVDHNVHSVCHLGRHLGRRQGKVETNDKNDNEMRRVQSLRHHAKPSLVTMTDDLGVLREDESVEDSLRRELLAKDRENDKLQAHILSLQDQLSQRPPLEQIQALEKEYKNLELLLQGTQRENERCMAELERGRNREKMLERELERLAGVNWQTSLNIPASTTFSHRSTLSVSSLRGPLMGDTSSFFLPQAESTHTSELDPESTFDASDSTSTILSPSGNLLSSPVTPRGSKASGVQAAASAQMIAATLSQISQVRTLILGMEERMQSRETKLQQVMTRAEEETQKIEHVRREIDATS